MVDNPLAQKDHLTKQSIKDNVRDRAGHSLERHLESNEKPVTEMGSQILIEKTTLIDMMTHVTVSAYQDLPRKYE